jgi:hypothetical protein
MCPCHRLAIHREPAAPDQKPVAALSPLIESFPRPGDTVLDPFAGSGSALFASKKLDRNHICWVDLDARHHAIVAAEPCQLGASRPMAPVSLAFLGVSGSISPHKRARFRRSTLAELPRTTAASAAAGFLAITAKPQMIATAW